MSPGGATDDPQMLTRQNILTVTAAGLPPVADDDFAGQTMRC
jgi:hypothetical protein